MLAKIICQLGVSVRATKFASANYRGPQSRCTSG